MSHVQRHIEKDLLYLLDKFPAVGLVGARQVGKTTLAKDIIGALPRPAVYLDLELPSDRNKLREPELYLNRHRDKTVVLDEVQRMPELFPLLRALIDQQRVPGRFLLLGSASPEFLLQSSESLAGRVAYLELQPIHLDEIPSIGYQTHWLQGGFPSALLAENEKDAFTWLQNFILTYVERDLSLLGLSADPLKMQQFLSMLAGVQGSLLNQSMLSKSLGLSVPTISKYLNFLEHFFLIRRLPAFHSNIRKRLVKTPKIYFRDSGVLHQLLGITSMEQLFGHPLLGASWEGYALQQLLSNLPPALSPFFFRTQDGVEIDLVLVKGIRPVAVFEIKFSQSPQLSQGIRFAMEEIGAERNYVLVPEGEEYPIGKGIIVCGLSRGMEVVRGGVG